MRRIIKIGFPILCIAVIGGTFILLNKTTSKINKNRLKENEADVSVAQNFTTESIDEEEIENVILTAEEIKVQEVKNKSKAIELVKELAPSMSNSYYTNESIEDGKYIVAIRENETKDAIIYYAVDIENDKIEIYAK